MSLIRWTFSISNQKPVPIMYSPFQFWLLPSTLMPKPNTRYHLGSSSTLKISKSYPFCFLSMPWIGSQMHGGQEPIYLGLNPAPAIYNYETAHLPALTCSMEIITVHP